MCIESYIAVFFFFMIQLQEIINNNIFLSLTNNDGLCVQLRLTGQGILNVAC